jgi:anaerobic selenocysteine-containing dehydrogenase
MVIDLNALEGKAYNPKEAAKIAGVNADTMRKLCKTGVIKAAKPRGSKCYIILGKDLIRYFEGEPARGKGGKTDGRKA